MKCRVELSWHQLTNGRPSPPSMIARGALSWYQLTNKEPLSPSPRLLPLFV
jgi:hypothetical protein